MSACEVTLLCDNSVRAPGLLAEHGLALWIEGPWGRLPLAWEELEALGARLCPVSTPQSLGPGLWVSGEIPRDPAWEPRDERLCVWGRCGLSPDPLWDDQSLFLTTPDGAVVVTGCAHAGLVNIVRRALAVTGARRVQAVLGGTHLIQAPPELVDGTAVILDELGVEQVVACHCTGFPALRRLAQRLGERVVPGAVGERRTF